VILSSVRNCKCFLEVCIELLSLSLLGRVRRCRSVYVGVLLIVFAGSDIPLCSVAELEEKSRQQLEADCFWCFSKLLDGIQDNYTFAQPGIQRRISSLKELVSRIDGEFSFVAARCYA